MAEPSISTPVPAAPWRHVGFLDVEGRCLLEDGSEHACLAQHLTTSGSDIACAARPGLGERVICYFGGIGALYGHVAWVERSRFRLGFDPGEARRDRIAARLAWHETRSGEQRRSPRLVPVNDRTELCLTDRRVAAARIIDLTMTGVALRVEAPDDLLPPAGTVVRIGLRYATVVRPTAKGFAARFRLPFRRETFDSGVIL